jgi:hypothetical protein
VKMIEIPSSVKFIGNSCFSECMSLDQIKFESGIKLQHFHEYAFNQSSEGYSNSVEY